MNQRREQRLQRDDQVHIQVQRDSRGDSSNREHRDADEALVLHTTSRDISQHGFKASANRALVIGAVLDVLLELPEQQAPFLLTAEVRWCTATPEGFSIGFELLPAAGSDYHAWQQQLTARD